MSRARVAWHIAAMLKDKPGGKRERYGWTTVDGWLREAGWTPVESDE